MGFQTGNILEPAMGVGNFFGLLPQEMQGSRLYGVELDSITGRIAKQLYPKADITVAGFETTDRRDFFDLAIGNVPFGQYQVNDRAYNKLGFSIHDYFFAKTLDQVRPGGVIAFVTSRYTMDKQSPEVRKYIAQRAELLGAIRLPNHAFKANAGTEVVSDIIFLQKRDRPIDIEPDWVHLGENEDGFSINQYFIDNPEMVLGRQTSESTQYGRQDFTVEPYEDLDLATQLRYAIQNIGGKYEAAELPDLGENETIQDTIPADPNVKNYSYAVVDGEVYYRENSVMVKPSLNATAKERVKGMAELRDCVYRLIDLQMWESDDISIRAEQQRLNRLYDRFTEKYGLINSRGNALAFADDSSYYAEIKALCAGDERIREKMDLDVDVARLRLMKANHQSQQYRLEDNILRHFPAQIEENKGFLSGFEADMKTLEAHPHPKDGFAGMEVKGDFLTDKDNAGAAILEAFKDAKGLEPVPIGSYRGFAMSLTVENFGKDFILTLKGKMSHRVELGKDARGNLVRIDNALAQMPERYKTVQGRLENVQAQLATAKAELGKPFPQEAELKEKSARLAELNAELNIDDRTPMEQAAENVVAKRPSVLDKLKAPCVHGAGEKKKSHEQEAR